MERSTLVQEELKVIFFFGSFLVVNHFLLVRILNFHDLK